MELDMLEVFLSHAQDITTVGKKHITTILILCHILILALLEILQLSLVVTLYPASFIQMNWLPTALRIILVFKTILYDLKLQLTHCANNLSSIKLIDKQLCHTFVHELVDTFLKLFCLHRVVILNIFK